MMSASEFDQTRLEIEEKLLKILNLHADTLLKESQYRYEPWKVVISAFAAGGAVAAGLLALYKALGV